MLPRNDGELAERSGNKLPKARGWEIPVLFVTNRATIMAHKPPSG
jgi:hypothetical protein